MEVSSSSSHFHYAIFWVVDHVKLVRIMVREYNMIQYSSFIKVTSFSHMLLVVLVEKSNARGGGGGGGGPGAWADGRLVDLFLALDLF